MDRSSLCHRVRRTSRFSQGGELLAAAFREVVRSKPLARLLLVGSGEQDSSIRTLLAEEFANGSVHIERGVNHDELPELGPRDGPLRHAQPI